MKPDDGADDTEDYFPKWTIGFNKRDYFDAAMRLCCPDDIGHADMIFTYNTADGFFTDKRTLLQAGIFDFNEQLA